MRIPVILSTWSFGVVANRAGWPVLQEASGSALDAVEQACVAVEDDLSVDSVGRGGLPDAAGHVSVDGCVMLSPARSAGVAYVRRYAHPVSIARKVMERTPHKLLVGDGAERFAAECGLMPVELLTDDARMRWDEWAAHQRDDRDRLRHDAQSANREEMKGHDTVGVLAIDGGGVMAGACSTSGLPFKLPGRVGDSPILGQGLYVDPAAGGAVATGNGELMMGTCASFLAVERMRAGDAPIDAIRVVLNRVAAAGYALKDREQCALIAVRPDGTWACGSLRAGFRVAVTDDAGERLVESEVVLMMDGGPL